MRGTIWLLLLTVAAAGCARQVAAPAVTPRSVPAPTAAPDIGKRDVAPNGMVASAHPLASEAGAEMLRRGGNAVDAAVAAAFAVGVVEPMMSGVGGGGGMLIWLAEEGRAEYIDFYSSAGAAPDTSFRSYRGSSATARGVAVPGAVAGLLEAHERYGRLSRAEVLAPAIRLADQGFPVHSLLARLIAADSAKLTWYAGAQRIFWPGMRPLGVGETLRQPELAATLRAIAERGRAGFYEGDVAREIVRVLNDGGNPTTLDDLASFRARWRRPLCGEYRGRVVLSAPPPQSGMQVLETLHLLSAHDLPALGLPTRSPEAFGILASALRVAMVDRNAYVGDPDHAAVPAAGVASAAFARERTALVGNNPMPARIPPGDPWDEDRLPPSGACAALDPAGPAVTATEAAARIVPGTGVDAGDDGLGETTHLSAVDAAGNAVSLTYTQGQYFGTGVWAAGTFLNSGLFNFSSSDSSANALGPRRVPSSTIAPTIVLEDGRVRMVVGSPGSGAIPPAIVETIIYTLDYGLDPLEALRMPRVLPAAGSLRMQLEDGFDAAVAAHARRMGWIPRPLPPTDRTFGGVHVIVREGAHWVGAADPRRNGEVRGH